MNSTEGNEQKASTFHGLLYSTGILILLCGVPGTIIYSVLLLISDGYRVSLKDAFSISASMLSIEIPFAVVLLLLANAITKYRKRKLNS